LLLVALGLLTRFGPGYLEGGMSSYWMVGLLGPLLCSVLILIWWVTASRATGKERLWGFIAIVVFLSLTVVLVDPTMRGPGTMQLTAPIGMMAFALAAVAMAGRRPMERTGLAVLLAVAGFAFSLLLRNEGATGEYWLETRWRWSRSAEEKLLAARKLEPATKVDGVDPASAVMSFAKPEWPGFRGADRAARAQGPPLATNWTAHPPRQLWKIQVGPAWSSFAVAGNFLFTQEQRGPMEMVVCYHADTGREVWKQQVEARFDDPLGGPGPRATPTVSKDGLFVTGATGIFLCLNPATGNIVWQHDLQQVAGRKAPMWGFSASPVVAGSVVIVYAGGPGDKGVLAFDVATGALRWSAAAGNDSYSSPQLNSIAGEDMVLMLSNEGLVFLDPVTGKARLNYAWKFSNYRALQPHVVDGNTLLLPTGMGTGTRAIRIIKTNEQFAAEESWTARNLKPDFTDFVSYQGYLFGTDGGIFTCVDLQNGERKWKGGRYGKGQVLLLENSGLLLVAAEQGEVVLLRADPNAHTEVDSFKALDGKTWNHPVVVGARLYLRNAQEAACYVLPLAQVTAKVDQP
jgi:outer membrane protein assembly factor BamB